MIGPLTRTPVGRGKEERCRGKGVISKQVALRWLIVDKGSRSNVPPAFDSQARDATKVAGVFCNEDRPVCEGGRGQQDIGVADELALSVEVGINIGCTNDDLIRQWHHMTLSASGLECRDLLGRALAS